MAFWKKKPEEAAPPAAAEPAPAPAPTPAAAPAAAPPPAAEAPPAAAAAPAPAAEAPAAAEQAAPRGQPSLNSQLAASLGKVVSVLMFSERYRSLTLRDITSLILPPITTNQFVVAEARPQGQDVTAPIGLLLWARLSDELDQKFSTDASVPTKLQGAEWNSGDNLWVIETVGPPNVIEAMMKQLVEGPFKGQVFKFRAKGPDGSFRVQVIDPAAAQTA